MAKQLHIGLSLTPTWLKGRAMDDPDARPTRDPVAFNLALTRMAELAKLDFVFKPDYLLLHPGAAGSGFVGLDPTLLLTALACQTDRIGLVTTVSTSFNPPFVAARQIQSLHWISRGRVGLNIVTSIEGAENFGDAPMSPPEVRYRKAAEFTDVMRKLWRSYPHEALTGAAPSAAIDHRGEFFSVKGPLNVPGHAAGPPPLFQAGASDIGRDFASSIADATFAAMPDREAGIELRGDLRRRARGHGRSPDSVRVLPGLHFFLAETREEAWALHARAHAHLTAEQRRKMVKSVLGLELGDLPSEARVTTEMLPPPDTPVRSRTHAELLRRFIAMNEPTVAQVLARPEVVGSAHWVSIGTVDDVLADIADWFEAGAIDGFIAIPGGSMQSLRLFMEELVPALARRGLFRSDYDGATLRQHLRIDETR